MIIQDIYKKNKKKFLFFDNKNIQDYKEEILLRFNIKYFDKKNNESLKNISIKKFFEFEYKYNLPEDPSLTKLNKDGSYSIVLVNGQCEKFSDENIEINNLLSENINDFFNNKLSDKKDFFVDLNSLFLNSGFKLKIKSNKKF